MNVLFGLFAAAVVALGAGRAAIETFNIEAETGFYSNEGPLVQLQNVLYIAAVVLILYIVIRRKRVRPLPAKASKTLMCNLLFFSGPPLLAASLVSLIPGVSAFVGGQGSLLELAALVLQLCAGVVLMRMAFYIFHNGSRKVGLWPAAVPAVWLIVDAIVCFLRYETIVNISGQRFEVAALCTGALFFLSHARLCAKKIIELQPRKTRLFAMAFCLFAVPLCAGQGVAVLLGSTNTAQMPIYKIFALFVLGLYAGIFSVNMREY